MTAPDTITVYTAQGCCLCDDAAAVLAPLAQELGISVEWIFIDGDAELERKYREQIPVGYFAEKKIFKYSVDAALLRRRVASARSVTSESARAAAGPASD